MLSNVLGSICRCYTPQSTMKLPLLSLLLAQPCRGAFQQRVEPPHSSSRRRAALTRLSDASWFDRLGSFLSPAEDEVAPWEASAEVRDAVRLLCREGGWKLRCTLGTAAAKSVGGSGELVKRRTPALKTHLEHVLLLALGLPLEGLPVALHLLQPVEQSQRQATLSGLGWEGGTEGGSE